MKGDFTKAKQITEATKRKVLERQGYRSITGAFIPDIHHCDFHHVVFKSGSGIGYEWNVVAILRDEHRDYHDGKMIKVNGRPRYTPKEFETLMKNHLKLKYDGWSEEMCRFHKYWEEKDYQVRRKDGNRILK